MFENARLKLTAQYLLIIMIISLLFSSAIYLSITNEFRRFERMQVRIEQDFEQGKIPPPSPSTGHNFVYRIGKPDPEFISAARARIILALGVINLIIFMAAGAAGYFLAGRTLKPIGLMIDEQKRFVADASHELRTPLTSLRSEIEVALRNKKITDDEAKKILKSNLEEVIALQALSDNLLELAQDSNNSDFKNATKISIAQVISVAVKQLDRQAKYKKMKVINKVRNENLTGNFDRLGEVFVILLDNAIKYSPLKSEIKILSENVGDKLKISVINPGAGISPEDLPHIFDRFFRGDKSRSGISGYGLGLSIAKKIIEAHNGSIIVESNLNKSTKFTVIFNSV